MFFNFEFGISPFTFDFGPICVLLWFWFLGSVRDWGEGDRGGGGEVWVRAGVALFVARSGGFFFGFGCLLILFSLFKNVFYVCVCFFVACVRGFGFFCVFTHQSVHVCHFSCVLVWSLSFFFFSAMCKVTEIFPPYGGARPLKVELPLSLYVEYVEEVAADFPFYVFET